MSKEEKELLSKLAAKLGINETSTIRLALKALADEKGVESVKDTDQKVISKSFIC